MSIFMVNTDILQHQTLHNAEKDNHTTAPHVMVLTFSQNCGKEVQVISFGPAISTFWIFYT